MSSKRRSERNHLSICALASGFGNRCSPPSFVRAARSHLYIILPSGLVLVTTTASNMASSCVRRDCIHSSIGPQGVHARWSQAFDVFFPFVASETKHQAYRRSYSTAVTYEIDKLLFQGHSQGLQTTHLIFIRRYVVHTSGPVCSRHSGQPVKPLLL